MSIILITGGSGLVGQRLSNALLRDGHEVRWLSRSAGGEGAVRRYAWDTAKGIVDTRALEHVEHIIHLSGAGIADKRWTTARMHELYASRGGAARLLLKVTRESGSRPRSFISASGIGYYGAITSDHLFVETDPVGNDAIARLTKNWEDAADEWSPICRVVKLRAPMVLAREGGALKRLAAPIHWGLGAALGSGKQWMPWVHIDDLVNAYIHAIADERMSGAYNVNAPEQPTNRSFMRAVAKTLHKPFFLPNVPRFALKLALGELSSVLLEGSQASNVRLTSTGFGFRYHDLETALLDTLGQ